MSPVQTVNMTLLSGLEVEQSIPKGESRCSASKFYFLYEKIRAEKVKKKGGLSKGSATEKVVLGEPNYQECP